MHRPGTMDTSVPQTVMATFDLASVGYYNQLALFNVLNGSMNRGWLGFFKVTPEGFSIRNIDSGKKKLHHLQRLHGSICHHRHHHHHPVHFAVRLYITC